MITFTPINENIQKTLFEKMDMLDKNPVHPIGTPRSENGSVNENYMLARSTWLKMVSLTPPKNNKPVILMGGEADSNGNLVSNLWGSISSEKVAAEVQTHPERAFRVPKIGGGSYTHTIPASTEILEPAYTKYDIKHGRYYADGATMPFRPMAGIKDVSVEYKGGGMRLGATRTATINWTCWTWEELDRLMPHFLHHGKSVFIEWGWSGIGALKGIKSFINEKLTGKNKVFDEISLQNFTEDIPEHILQQNGNYDAMLGKVQNFTWTVRDDGGFDCTTTLISLGVSALQQTLKNDSGGQIMFLPLLVDSISGWFTDSTVWKAPDSKALRKIDLPAGGNTKPHGLEDTDDKKPFHSSMLDADEAFMNLSPYFTFKNYMSDFPEQLQGNLLRNTKVRNSGQVIMGYFKNPPSQVSRPSDYNSRWKKNKGATGNIYCSWGWFEDNVLSRFFTTIGKDRVKGEFRSIENIYDKDGNIIDQKPVKIRNSPYLYTTDTRKFIIFNNDELTNGMISMIDAQDWTSWWKNWQGNAKNLDVNNFLEEYGEPNFGKPKMFRGEVPVQSKKQGGGQSRVRSEDTVTFEGEDEDDSLTVSTYGSSNSIKVEEELSENEGYLRNIYFSAFHLRNLMKDASTLEEAVNAVWNDFSNEYGGIYRFKIDYADDGNRLLLRDKGWTESTVKTMLENPSIKPNPGAPDGDPENVGILDGLFTFPVWEKNSMVKSQNLSAKLPKRMQLAAMYGSNKPLSPEPQNAEDRTEEFDERAALAWGKLFSPKEKGTGGAQKTLEQYRDENLEDLISGDIDFPSSKNRSFGNADASVGLKKTDKLYIGTKDNIEEGTIVYPSITDNIGVQQKEELQRRFALISDDGGDIDDKKEKIEYLSNAWKGYTQEGAADVWWKFYTVVTANKKGVYRGESINAHITNWQVYMRPEIKHLMINKLKGAEGLYAKTDPIIPVELEIELDGMGGIFPGNAFQSSYVSSRYKEMACFQVVGANQTIDSTGWTTSLKGQIRVSVEKEIEEDIQKIKGWRGDSGAGGTGAGGTGAGGTGAGGTEAGNDEGAHEDAVGENYDNDAAKKADTNLKSSDIGGSKALKIRKLGSDLMPGVEEAKPNPSNLPEMSDEEALSGEGILSNKDIDEILGEEHTLTDGEFDALEDPDKEKEYTLTEPPPDITEDVPGGLESTEEAYQRSLPPLPKPERPDIPYEPEEEEPDIPEDLVLEHFDPWPDPPPPPENPNPDPQYVDVVNNNNPNAYWSDSSNRVIEVINPGTPLHLQNTLSDGITTDVPNNETINSIANTFDDVVSAINYAEGAENVKGNDLSSQWFANMYAMGYSDIKISSTLDDNGNLIYGLNCNIGPRPPLVGYVNVYITGTDGSNYNAYISDTGGNSWNVGNRNE